MKLNLDLRLIDIELELSALNDQFSIIESHIERLIKEKHKKLEEQRINGAFKHEDDLITELEIVHHNIDIHFPRVFWSPFIVSVHSVFEASILEVAEELQRKKGIGISINDLNGSLLDKFKKYFDHILNFQLVTDNEQWRVLKELSIVRNAVAHANGRIDRLKLSAQKKIQQLEESNAGISNWMGLLVIEQMFAKRSLEVVSDTIGDLCARYKAYDSDSKIA
ncbi:MAG: hypothetical protein ACXWUD_10750 [Methylosarcina sp.]